MKKIELTVREIDVAKFEKDSSYLVLLHPRFFSYEMIGPIQKHLEKRLHIKVACLVAEPDSVKIYGLPKEKK